MVVMLGGFCFPTLANKGCNKKKFAYLFFVLIHAKSTLVENFGVSYPDLDVSLAKT